MAKKINSKKVKRSIKSSLDFSKIYFSKSTSVVLITTYSVVLFLALSVLGFSSLIAHLSTSNEVPSLPEEEPFAFLPADNLEVPTLGDVEPEKEPKKSEEKPQETPAEEVPKEQPVVASTPVATREVVRTVVKEVPKEVVKVVQKEEPTQEYYDNYPAPKAGPIGDFPVYENFPDEDPVVEEPTTENTEEQE